MDNEKIKELAQKFADKAFADADMSDFLTQEHKFCVTNACIAFGNFLMETHCIVEKEKVKNFLEQSEVHALDAIDTVEFIEDVFGSELFNDKEK